MSCNHEIVKYFNFTKNLTIEAGKILKEAINLEKTIEFKDHCGDLVTQTDKNIEQILITALKNEYPNHKFLAEESSYGSTEKLILDDAPTWIIDPIDGTTNFVHGFPQCCISIGLSINKIIELGIIYNPSNDELYTAIKGQGAFLNGKRLKASNITELSRAMIIIEPTMLKLGSKFAEIWNERISALCKIAEGSRNVGSAALAMAYVARGIIDAFHLDGLKPWDVAAGYLIINEAGGTVISSKGGPFNFMEPMTLATSTIQLATEISKIIIDSDLQIQRKKIKENNDK
ncbi:hypothetical protein HCN44_005506 [Aphidius gifuensis]|uniref:Inositol-1-monophosphatase n=1 Tax=Aphidius gifuensis TaxID=684658 RepID=A0A835CUP6_APHGI|nr:inositol monophosphatase 1-like [Aphidius gifuensis]KAF7997229.1 hypothetical protein HCN44_005506 [Aphidius gifuensis]